MSDCACIAAGPQTRAAARQMRVKYRHPRTASFAIAANVRRIQMNDAKHTHLAGCNEAILTIDCLYKGTPVVIVCRSLLSSAITELARRCRVHTAGLHRS